MRVEQDLVAAVAPLVSLVTRPRFGREAKHPHRVVVEEEALALVVQIEGADLVEALPTFKHIFTLESHYVTGGIGSLVAEVVAEHRLDVRVVRLGFESVLNGYLGSAAFLHDMYGLSGEKIASRIADHLRQNA